MKRAVFLDRDGVINEAPLRDGQPIAPAKLSELRVLPGVPKALEALKEAGLTLIVVTNQPDVAKGSISRDEVEAMHEHMRAHLPLDDIKVCYHVDEDRCACRKPKPGMFIEAAQEYGIDLRQSFMIGDRWRDIGAGQAAGCHTVLVDYGYREQKSDAPDYVVPSLVDASPIILSWMGQHPRRMTTP